MFLDYAIIIQFHSTEFVSLRQKKMSEFFFFFFFFWCGYESKNVILKLYSSFTETVKKFTEATMSMKSYIRPLK